MDIKTRSLLAIIAVAGCAEPEAFDPGGPPAIRGEVATTQSSGAGGAPMLGGAGGAVVQPAGAGGTTGSAGAPGAGGAPGSGGGFGAGGFQATGAGGSAGVAVPSCVDPGPATNCRRSDENWSNGTPWLYGSKDGMACVQTVVAQTGLPGPSECTIISPSGTFLSVASCDECVFQ